MDTIGIIGGSGLYDIDGIENVKEVEVETPFGSPSDKLITGELEGKKLVFLPRHGRGHRILPSEVNYRANIYALKSLGVEWIISFSAVGSMKDEIEPGHIVIIDQFIDRTKKRESTFFGEGIVGHIEFAEPICSDLATITYSAANKVGSTTVHKGGTYICIEGPQFSTKAESNLYRSWGVDVIGMTNIPEAKLAREAEICYSTIALSTDYDCWNEGKGMVTVEEVLAVIGKNVAAAREIIKEAVRHVEGPRQCKCATAAQFAVITDRAKISDEAKEKLSVIVGKYL